MNISQVLTKLKALIYSKSETDSLLGGKANSSHTHTKSQITDFPAFGTTAGTICQGNDSRLSDARTPTSHTHTKSQITDFPTIPTVNNATLTIQKNGSNVATFTSNASSNVTANITVPTKTSELTNNSGFLTSHQSLANYVTSSNLATALSDKVDRIDHGYTYITGNGTYSWCKLATITIKSAYINNPITFEVDGRGRLKSTIQIVFASSSEIDPALSSFTSDVDMNFYIKKVATSTWELYGNYSETWGKFTLYRVTSSLDSSGVVINTTPSNLSSAPSGTTRVSANDLYVGSYRVYVG